MENLLCFCTPNKKVCCRPHVDRRSYVESQITEQLNSSISCRRPRLSAAPIQCARIEHVLLNHHGDLHGEILTQIKLDAKLQKLKLRRSRNCCCSLSSKNLQTNRD